jgi:hypothetical protein
MSARGRPRRRGRVYRNVSSFRAHARAYAAFMRSVRVSRAAVQYTVGTELVDNSIVFHNALFFIICVIIAKLFIEKQSRHFISCCHNDLDYLILQTMKYSVQRMWFMMKFYVEEFFNTAVFALTKQFVYFCN